jgi:hypothetical protein
MTHKKFGPLGIHILLLPIASAQNTENESRSLGTCLSYMGSLIMEVEMSIPTNESIFPVLVEPEVRTYLLNHCILYHNKKGIWQDWSDPLDSVNETIIEEFETKYPPPDILRDFFLRK